MPKFALYWPAECRSDREELRPIWGRTVHIIDRTPLDNGEWRYKVFGNPADPQEYFDCFESELLPYRGNIIAQSARLRHSLRSEGVRTLLRRRGYDPMRCLQVACDQGTDIDLVVALPNGSIVGVDCRERPRTWQADSSSNWVVMHAAEQEIEVRDYYDAEDKLARDLVMQEDTSELDDEIRGHYDEHLAEDDHPLPADIEF